MSPLFLDPVTARLDDGLEMVQAAPSAFVQHEVRRLAAICPPGPYLRSLAARDRDTWRGLDLALRAARRHLVEEAWPRILTSFHADLTWRSRLVGGTASDALAKLLGHTRAAILGLLLTEHTTTQIADELEISAATVSGHTKVLRTAGLIATSRAGKSVLHALTPLGARLLSSCPPARPRQVGMRRTGSGT